MDLVIVNYNSLHYLSDCLTALHRYTPQPYQIIVVDNASNDGSVSYLQGRGGIETIFNLENRGYAVACNQGIRQGKNPYVVLLNPDVKVTKGWWEPLLAAVRPSDVAVVGPKMANSQGLLVGAGVTSWDELTRPRFWLQPDRPGLFTKPEECITVGGACYLIKRALIPVLGYFDERYFLYFEETDYSINAVLKGYKVIFNPLSVVYHEVGGSSSESHSKRLVYFQESQRRFVQKWAGRIPCLP